MIGTGRIRHDVWANYQHCWDGTCSAGSPDVVEPIAPAGGAP